MANRVLLRLVKSSRLFKEQSRFAQTDIQMPQQPKKRHLTESSQFTYEINTVIPGDSLARAVSGCLTVHQLHLSQSAAGLVLHFGKDSI